MGALLDKLVGFFESDDWNFSRVEGRDMLRMGFGGDNGRWTLLAQAREEADQVVIYSLFPSNAPENTRAEVSRFLHMANYGLMVGNFEFDWSDGEVRYKTSVMVSAEQLTDELIRHLVYPNVLTLDRYFPGVMGIIYAGRTAEDCIREIEGGID